MHFPTDRSAYTPTFDGPIVYHWLEHKIAQTANASAMQNPSAMQADQNLYSRVLYHLTYIAPLFYILVTSKIISGRVSSCDRAQSKTTLRCCSTGTRTWYLNQSHYPNTKPTNSCSNPHLVHMHISYMNNNRLEMSNCQNNKNYMSSQLHE